MGGDGVTEDGLSPAGDSDTWKGTAVGGGTAAEVKAACCAKTATCSAVTCTYLTTTSYPKEKSAKNKAGVATTSCGAQETATECGKKTVCCEVDAQKCGAFAMSDIVCPYGTIDERLMWNSKTLQSVKDTWNNKAGNSTNKNTNCCTPVAACALPVGTTTPAATATPAAPALKFSQRQAAVEESHSSGANMVWLGAGALIGMSVLMVVQGM